MNPKLKSTSANPAAARNLGPTVKATLDHDLVFVGQPQGCEVEAREVAVEMLELSMTSDCDFRQRQKLGQKSLFDSTREPDRKKASDDRAVS
jgi:hypothetical protein